MTKRAEVMERVYWLSNPDWYEHDETKSFFNDGAFRMKPDAPERAKKSYEEWLKHKDD